MQKVTDYSSGKIYRLNVGDQLYVGSTVQPLYQRLSEHKHRSRLYPHRTVYREFANVGLDNVSIELVEEYHCGSSEELRRRERDVIEQLGATLNARSPYAPTKYGNNN